jgi:hypothetical protein
MTTLDAIRWKLPIPTVRTGALVKIDVEGAEEDVLQGAASWLQRENCFLIEVHEEEFLERIMQLFAARGLTLDSIDQRPLWVVGGEVRERDNWWLESRLDSNRLR